MIYFRKREVSMVIHDLLNLSFLLTADLLVVIDSRRGTGVRTFPGKSSRLLRPESVHSKQGCSLPDPLTVPLVTLTAEPSVFVVVHSDKQDSLKDEAMHCKVHHFRPFLQALDGAPPDLE